MTRFILLISLALCLLSAKAQRVKHPCLLYTPERIELAKQRMNTEPAMRQAWESIGSVEI